MRKILVVVFLLVSVVSFGQKVQFPTTTGIGWRNTGADTLLWVPSDTSSVASYLNSRTHFAIKNGVSYYWNGSVWAALSGGGGSSYSAGYGLSLTGTTFRADSSTLAAYFLRRKDSATGTNLNGYLTRSSLPTIQQVTNITYANLVTAIAGSTLVPGVTYKITDRGDRGLFFKAVSSNELAKDGTRLMLCPSDYAIETDAHGNVWKGIWASFKTASVNNLMIWGGKVYKNLTGSIGTATNDTLLDVTNWVAISKSSFTNYEYTEMSFGVNFDIANDWIEKQWDGKGNVITEPYYWSQNYYSRFIGNGCSITDWNLGSEFYNNTAMAVFNNADIYAIYNNICKSNAISNNVSSPLAGSPVYIYRNLCVDGIIGNYIGGGIYDNVVYQIARNKVSFDINDNVVTAVIADDTVSSIRANYVSTSIYSVYGPSYSVTGCFTNKDITGTISANYTKLTIENLPSGVGTKQVRYDPSTGNFTYTDTTAGGLTPTWQQTLTTGPTLTGNNTIAGGAFNFTFGNMGIFTVSQNAKSSVSGSNGTANVSPLTITGGAGGATSYSTGTVSGGNAGSVLVTAGNGGSITGTPTTGIGGTGGTILLTAGDGGLGTTNGGTGGNVEMIGGAGGGGTAGGAAGYASIKGGSAGSTGNADGGNIYLSPGIKNGSGLDGHIFLGVSPGLTVRGSATIGSATRGDSLFNVKSGGLYADRGVRFPNTPSFADTINYKPVVMNSSGTLYKATYWPGGGGGSTSPAGNYGNLQLNRNGAFDTPATDSLGYTASGGLSVKNKIVSLTGSFVGDNSTTNISLTNAGGSKMSYGNQSLLVGGSEVRLTYSTTGSLDWSAGAEGVGALFPTDDNQRALGSSTKRWRNIWSSGSFMTGYVAKAIDYTATANDNVIEVTVTGKTITLPTAVGITGRMYTIKLTASGSGTVATTSSQTIDGSTTYSLASQYKYVSVQSNGANWIVIANN